MRLPPPPGDVNSPKAYQEMERVVRERFPDRSMWSEIFESILQHARYDEYARFTGDDGASDVEFLFWAIQEVDSPDPTEAARWREFRSNPPRLNIARPRMEAISRIPSGVLPPGVLPPRRP